MDCRAVSSPHPVMARALEPMLIGGGTMTMHYDPSTRYEIKSGT